MLTQSQIEKGILELLERHGKLDFPRLVELLSVSERNLASAVERLVKAGRVKMSDPKEATRLSPQGYILVK